MREGRKKEASKVKQTNKAKQHSTPKAVTFPRKNELPQVGLEPTTLYTLDRALYQLSMYMYVKRAWFPLRAHACNIPNMSGNTYGYSCNLSVLRTLRHDSIVTP